MSTIIGTPDTVKVDGKDIIAWTPTPGRLSCFTDTRSRMRVYLAGQASSPYLDHYQEPEEPGERISMTGTVSGCHGSLESVLHRLDEGGWVIDKRHLDAGVIARIAISGPMGNPRLPPGTMSNRHDEFVPVDLAKVGGLTWVAIDVLCDYAEARGAKVGRRIGDEIVWRDGTRTSVEPCACWKGVCVGCRRLRHYVDRAPGGFYTTARNPANPADHCPECKARPEVSA